MMVTDHSRADGNEIEGKDMIQTPRYVHPFLYHLMGLGRAVHHRIAVSNSLLKTTIWLPILRVRPPSNIVHLQQGLQMTPFHH
jgi:hypothetical protein